ncbi:MAG: DUF2190 family protein [Proteobacteria bacterium]|nr:DUF2190 family protein [Pseudomonadota bacterium]
MIPQLTENPGKTITITAREVLQPYRFVGFSGHVCGAGEKSLGVAASYSSPFNENMDAAVVTDGIVIVEVSEEVSPTDVAKGIAITSDINGRGIKAKVGDAVNGYAISPSSGPGDHIRVKLI